MKTNTNKYLFWAGLLLCSAVGALAVPVTFQVDMGQQAGFDPANNRPEVRGPFNGWAGTGLTNVTGTTIYTNTIDITDAAGSWVQYKFYVGFSGTMNWESLGGWHPGGNRDFQVPSTAETLPVSYYSDVGPGGTSVAVTFQVDMTAQINAGFFHPESGDLIQAMGAFNNAWNAVALTNDTGASNPNLYSGTYLETARPPGTYIEYKFANNVGGLGTLSYESLTGYPDNNRGLILDPAGVTLPVVFFSDTSGYPIKAAVVFQVDLSSQILVGNFVPGTDQLWVRGDAMGWGDPNTPPSGVQMFEDTTQPGIYTNEFKVDNQLTGAAFTYKYTIWHTASSTTTWEDGDNKVVTFTGTEPTDADGYHVITVGPTLFNNFLANAADYLPADTMVTFTVDMTDAVGISNTTPDEVITWGDGSGHGVFLNGPFVAWGGVKNTWWPWAQTVVDGGPAAWQMQNDPIGSQIYKLDVLLPKGSPVRVQYKYSIDGWDNGGGAGVDRFRDVRTLGLSKYPFPQDTFTQQWVELQYDPADFGRLAIGAASGGTVPVQWSGRPGVHLQTTAALGGTWADLYNTDGTNWTAGVFGPDGLTSVTNYPAASGATFFRLVKPTP